MPYDFSSENTFHPPPNPLPLREGEGGGVIFILLCVGHRHESFMTLSALQWAHLGSNQGPTGYEPVALPIELWARSS